MPTYGYHWVGLERNTTDHESVFPNLFPNTLEEMCTSRILDELVKCGKKIEKTAKQISEISDNQRFEHLYKNSDYNSNILYHRTNCCYKPLSTAGHNSITSSSSDLQGSSHTSSSSSSKFMFTKSDYFIKCVNVTKQFLTSFLASTILDRLTDAARRQGNAALDGYLFCFSVLCNDRLAKLVVCLHKEVQPKILQNDTTDDAGTIQEDDEKQQDWSKFMFSGVGSDLFLACLDQLSGLSSLTIQDLATNEMLFVISDTCHRLLVLDISYSSQVSELGLVCLCGNASLPISRSMLCLDYDSIIHLGSLHPPVVHPLGCKYLRELHFNPRNRKHTYLSANSIPLPIMPRVIAYIFRHLMHLQVVNMENLFNGIEHYYLGNAGEYHPRPDRIPPLKLVQYIGQDDQLIDIVGICPKLRAYQIRVTSQDALNKLASALSNEYSTMSLEHVTLVYDERHQQLTGFNEFIEKCGHRISSLRIKNYLSPTNLDGEETEDLGAIVSLDDLALLSKKCKLLESLSLCNLKIGPLQQSTPVPSVPLEFRFLTSIELKSVSITHYPKETFKYILGNSPDLERILIQFNTTSFFFNDFLLDEILSLNPLTKLEEFMLERVALTLISAMRLFNSRPKFKSIGNLLSWDVEPSELTTFEKILRKAKGLNLLRHDVKIY